MRTLILAGMGALAVLLTGCGSTGAFSYGHHEWSVSNLSGTHQANYSMDKNNFTASYIDCNGHPRTDSQTLTHVDYNEYTTVTPVQTYPQYTYDNRVWGRGYGYVPYGGYGGGYATTQPIGGYAQTRPYR